MLSSEGIAQTDTPTPESTRRTRRTRRIVVVLIVLVLLVVAAGVLILAPGGDEPPRQAGSSLGASRGERLVGVVVDGQGRPTQVDLTVTADGRVSGVVAREPGARADIAATGATVLVRGNRQWWDSERPGQAAAPVGRWVADPELGRRLLPVRLLTPAAVAREIASPDADGWSRIGEQVVDGRPGVVWSDGVRTVVVSADEPHRLLTVAIPLTTDPSSMALPDPTGSGAEGPGATPQDPRADLRVLDPDGTDLDDVAQQVDGARRQAVPLDPGPGDMSGDPGPGDVSGDPGAGPGGGALAAEYGRLVGEDRRRVAAPVGAAPGPTAPGRTAAPGAEPRSVPGPGAAGSPGGAAVEQTGETGGVDLSSVELRYIGHADTDGGPQLTYAFSGRPTPAGRAVAAGGADAVNQASDAFFVWLALPPEKFWVNLNPTEPNRIIDPLLAQTDAGRVLLEADLAMKKISTSAVDPRTPLGKSYWSSLQTSSNGTLCTSSRYWIVPGPAAVHEQDGGLHILDAPLRVQVESEIPTPVPGDDPAAFRDCGVTTEQDRELNEAVERRLVLPRIEQAVNNAPEFAELRRVYLSRVAAEWYRQRGDRAGAAFDGLIDRGDVAPWAARTPWSPRTVFDRYVNAVRKPAVDVVQRETRGSFIYERRITAGGVDWAEVAFDDVDPATFTGRHAGRAEAVAGSFDGPTADRAGRVWLGSSSEIPDTWRGTSWASLGYPAVAVLVVAAGALWVRRWWRRRTSTDDATSGQEQP